MEKIDYYKIVIDGIDKTGKDLIKSYIWYLGKKKYLCYARGLISEIAYANLYGRELEYIANKRAEEKTIYVYLTVNKEDWEIRCKTTNEPTILFETNCEIFEDTVKDLQKKGIIKHFLTFNTSDIPPYRVAQAIVAYADELNKKCNKRK